MPRGKIGRRRCEGLVYRAKNMILEIGLDAQPYGPQLRLAIRAEQPPSLGLFVEKCLTGGINYL